MAGSILLSMKIAWGVIASMLSINYLQSRKGESHRPYEGASRIFIVIPLLREQDRLPGLLELFGRLMRRNAFLNLVLITTEREHEEIMPAKHQLSTPEMLEASDAYKQLPDGRKLHFHYPRCNETISEMLNFGVSELLREGICRADDYILIYNADSAIDDAAVVALCNRIQEEVLVAQQSSLFLKNISSLACKRAYLPAADAIYQSRWTLEREMPRYLIGCGKVSFVPSILRRNWFAHCVGHGLLIRVSVLTDVGGFPMPLVGLEDSGLGFKLRSLGLEVAPVDVLENSDAAETVRALIRQKATWVRGPLGSLEYFGEAWKCHIRNVRVVLLMLQGMYGGLKWSLGLAVLLGFFIVCLMTQHLFTFLILYGLYSWLPVAAVLYAWHWLPQNLFPRIAFGRLVPILLVYPLVPIVHGLSGLCGLVQVLRQVLRDERFRQMKTESI